LYIGSSVVWNLVAVSLVLWGIVSMKTNVKNIETRAYHINFNGTHVWTFNEKEAYEINEFFPHVKEILHGDKNVFVYPYCSIIYVFMNFKNPIGFDYAPVYAVNNNLTNTFAIPVIKLLKKYNVK
jgi:hypothetical protein